MNYPIAYVDYLVHFHGDRDYFECHELLEEHWKSENPDRRKHIWVGLIQIAVSLYHQRRENYNGAFRMMNSAIRIISNEKAEVQKLGLDYDALLKLLHKRAKEMQQKGKYESLYLPISDPSLTALCIKRSNQKGIIWWSKSDFSNIAIIHRHKLRDRTSVIEEREKSLRHKQNNRQ
jgi:uncharacterized protein